MNRSDQYTNSVHLLSLLGYKVICVNEDEETQFNTWVWSYDLKNEETYPASYSEYNVSIMMAPNLYKPEHFDLTRQVLNHGRDFYPMFEIHLLGHAFQMLLTEKALMQALNFLTKHSKAQADCKDIANNTYSVTPSSSTPTLISHVKQETRYDY